MQYDQETTPLLIQQDAQVIEFENPSKSTTFQTIANAINLLMGIGLLSIPYSFTKLGWTLSLILLPLFSISTFFTATLSPTYPKNAFTKLLFSFELFMAGVAMIILFGDSTATLLGLQGYNDLIMMMSIVLLTPLTFMDLSFLARMSSIGIISIVFLVFTLFWNLLECGVELGNTRMEPRGLADVGLGIGLLFVGFDGHAVFPSLYNNIENPQKFKLAMSSTYLYVSAIYTMVGVAGYAMYGDSLFPEIMLNFPTTGFVGVLTKISLFLLTLNPLTKYPLVLMPVNSSIEESFSIKTKQNQMISRTIVSLAALCIAVYFPMFDKVMGLIGALTSFLIALIIPIIYKLKNDWSTMKSNHIVGCSMLLVASLVGMSIGVYGVIFSN